MSSTNKKKSEYPHGHHESALRSHSVRRVSDSAAFLVPYLKPNMTILDVGCGPGSITLDFAENYVPQGHVTGADYSDEPLKICRENAEMRGIKNVSFQIADILNLPFEDNQFDVVYAHQVLQYIPDPVRALSEMTRVSSNIVAAREADCEVCIYYPTLPALEEWEAWYWKVARANGGDPAAGRKLHAWGAQAGMDRAKLTLSSSTWTWCTREKVDWWGGLWADRILQSNLATAALSKGISTQEDLHRMSNGFREWAKSEDAWFTMVHGEILYQK